MKAEAKNARKMQDELRETAQNMNNVLTTAGNVSPMFQAHAFNMETGENGIAFLIAEILTDREAVFPKGIEGTELRATAIAISLYTAEIEAEVDARIRAGSVRYPDATVSTYLSAFCNPDSKHFSKTTFQGMPMPRIGKIQLTNSEDAERDSEQRRPRCKWYLID